MGERDLERLERWIDALEDLVRIPGTRLTFGLDVVFGLVPVIGDFAGLVCGLPLVAVAYRRRLPRTVLLTMTANLLIDAVFGSVPLLGNVFDLVWKAHRRNLVLLRRPQELRPMLRDAGGRVAVLAAVVVLLAAVSVFLLAIFVWALFRLTAGVW